MAMTETSLRQPLRFSFDLHDGLFQQPLRPQLMKGDRQANMVIVSLTENKKPIDLTGVTASGSFISPVDRAEIPLTGEVEGNEARVTLVDECYAEDGHFELDIKLKLGGTERTILSITGEVLSKGSGVVIDVGDVIPSIDDIIAQYAEMKRVTDDAQAAAVSASNGAGNANTAAANANTAAAKINNMTVSAAAGTSAGATISEKNGAKHIAFTLPKGDKGDKGDPGTIENVTISSINGLPEALSQLSQQMVDYRTAVNLIDNGYWEKKREIINQLGKEIYNYGSTDHHMLDRWQGVPGMTIEEGFVTVFNTNGSTTYNLYQYFPLGTLKVGKTYTMAVKTSDETIHLGTATLVSGTNVKAYDGDDFALYVSAERSDGLDSCHIGVYSSTSVNIVWVALYEGAYTLKTLPPYVPKGYKNELEECRRHLRIWLTTSLYSTIFNGFITGSGKQISVNVGTGGMRATPTVTLSNGGIIVRNSTGYSSDASNDAPYTTPVVTAYDSGEQLNLNFVKSDNTAWADVTNNTLVSVNIPRGTVLIASARLKE